ncbi:unnamed protein product [Sphenostylis stenocarpa]|uniref:Bifunctional inhibitor/plant lipid transfer protein/seed storage helical domain-containing protein n=1 Tax=Sphenostylis stenocarpa TaxID=92480 RepID=A0AA86VHU3_9FABA|nr:unnamed protein product [Sphenostylis stenocarpa]
MNGGQQKMRAMVAGSVWLWLLVFVLGVGVSEGGDLAAKCNLLVQKVLPCLNFATGQAAVPTKECCEATLEIKKSDPECLCFAIQQTHKGSPEVKSMGIQEGRLLQLPSACNLKNASTSNCPKLLGLSPNSPDAAIFRNGSLGTNSTSTLGTATPLSDTHKPSFGTMLPSPLTLLLAAVVSAVLLLIPISSVNISYW